MHKALGRLVRRGAAVQVNPHRGEVAVRVNGTTYAARLSLGALVSLEAELGEPGLVALVERFESGRFASRDVVAVLAAGLRAGGWQGDTADLMAAEVEGGPAQAARKAAELLARAFGGAA